MAKTNDTAATLRSLQRVHKALKEHHAKASDLHDQAEAHVTKLLDSAADDGYGEHNRIQGADTIDRSNAFSTNPSAGNNKMAGNLVRLPNGDLDLNEDAKKELAKSIYSRPLAQRP